MLVLEKGIPDEINYRMVFHSDVGPSKRDIVQNEQRGYVYTDGENLYIPTASGFYLDGKPVLTAGISKYTRIEIKDRTVLLRDDALKAYREQNQLYDYGILIKVADKIGTLVNLKSVKHESIKVLYNDPSKEWKDPFVNGPNSR